MQTNSPVIKVHNNEQIVPSYGGFYCELSISNHTSSNIVYVDRWGDRQVIKPNRLYGSHEDGIHIYRRVHHGDRIDEHNLPVPVDMTETILRPSLYNVDGYYLPEEQVLICLEDREHLAHHPQLIASYDTVHREAVTEAIQDSPKITFSANDPNPTSPLDHVYCSIFGTVVPVRCTHYPSVETRFEITLSHGSEIIVIASDTFEELCTKGVLRIECGGEIMVLSTTELGAQTEHRRLKKESVTYLREEFQDIIQDEVTRADARNTNLIESLKLEIAEKDTDIRKLTTLVQEVEQMNAQLMGGKKADVELEKLSVSHETMVSKRDEQSEKTSRAKIATGGEFIKMIPTIAKVVTGVVVGILGVKLFAPAAGAAALLGFI